MFLKRTIAGAVLILLGVIAWGTFGPRTFQRSSSSESDVRRLLRDGHYEQAVAAARALAAHAEAESDSVRWATALDLLVEGLWCFGKASEPETHAFAERSLRIRERALGPDAGPVAESLYNVSLLRRGDAASAALTRALAIAEAQLDSLDPRTVKIVRNIGFEHLERGDYRLAGPRLERALDLAQRSPGIDPLIEASTLNGLALLDHFGRGDLVSARKRYERILEIRRRELRAQHPLLAGTYNNLGLVHMRLGDDEAARHLMESAIEIRTGMDPDHPLLSSSLNNLAILQEKAGEFEASQRSYERALHIAVKHHGQRNLRVAQTLHNLGWLHYIRSHFAAAGSLYARSLDAFDHTLGTDHIRVSSLLLDLGTLLYQLGNADSARVLYGRALAIEERELGPSHPDVAVTLGYHALLRADLGDANAALELAMRAERIGREHLMLTSRTLAEREALLYYGTRARGLGLILSLAATQRVPDTKIPMVWDALMRARALVLDEMASRRRSVSRASTPEVERLASELAEARNRLASLAVRGGADDPPRHRQQLADARHEKERLERALAERSAEFRLRLMRSRAGYEGVLESVPPEAAVLAYAVYKQPASRAPGASSSADANDVHRPPFGHNLRSQDERLIAFVMRAGERPYAVDLGDTRAVRELVRDWMREAALGVMVAGRTEQDALLAYRLRGESLRKAVWDPVLPYLQDATRIFVIPDGALHQVHFAALPDGEGSYLIESGRRFHYLASERDLIREDAARAVGSGLLAVGGASYDDVVAMDTSAAAGSANAPAGSESALYRSPLYAGDLSCAEIAQLEFSALPATRREVAVISSIWSQTRGGEERTASAAEGFRAAQVLAGSQASEAQFKRAAQGKRVLHLATHGFFLGGACGESDASTRGAGGELEDGRGRWTPSRRTSPLLQSGLVMAGANFRDRMQPGQEDGILTGEEIAALDLDGVELAVLSACDTGAGDVLAGEGVLGLRRAFQVAGARSLIMSLWSVSDTPTQEWMEAFYGAYLNNGLGIADAAHAASLDMLRARRAAGIDPHPFFWAAFVSTGDWH